MDRDRAHPDDSGKREDLPTSGSSSKQPYSQLAIIHARDRQTVSKGIPLTAHDAAALRSSETSDTE